MESIGNALKYQREIHNLNQSKLAAMTGISQPKISYYESGKHLPSIEECITLADFYGITLDELVGRDYGRENNKEEKQKT